MSSAMSTATIVCSGAEGTHSTSASTISATGRSVATERWKGRSGRRSEVIASSVTWRAPSFASPETSSVRVSRIGAAISRLVMRSLLRPVHCHRSGPTVRSPVGPRPARRRRTPYAESMSTPAKDTTARTGTPPEDPALRDRIIADVTALRDSFDAGTTRDVAARLAQLEALRRGLRREEPRLSRALAQDLGKSRTESAMTEIGVVAQEIAHTAKHLKSWLKPTPLSLGPMLAPATGQLRREPLGTTLIISPWNYPVNLTLAPLVAAIAGGNTAIVKPSEVAPATSAALTHLLRTHLDPQWVRVVEGGVEETTILLEQRFDLIFYTGNGTVGRIVARAAAEHLTPTVLELGGKSPVFVDEGADLAVTARRIVWGKFTNAGQTCIAPDYLMATPRTIERLRPHLRRAVRAMYGRNPGRSLDYGRMV